MKKILSIILGVFLCAQAFAQINVNAGYLNTAYRHGGSDYSYKVNGNGFYAGVSTDVTIDGPLAFAPGLNFNFVDYNYGDGLNTYEYLLNAPLHLKYSLPVSNIADIFVSAGPTVLCSLGGKTKVSYGGASYTENEKGGDFDVTLGFEGGAELSNNFRLMFGYDFGLVNQSGDDDYRITRNFFHVGVGYRF